MSSVNCVLTLADIYDRVKFPEVPEAELRGEIL